MSSSDAHVIVRGQAQAVLIKVWLLRDYGERIASDPSFTRVFDGALHLADRRFAIGEVLGGSRFVTYIGGSQRWRVRVASDDPKVYVRAGAQQRRVVTSRALWIGWPQPLGEGPSAGGALTVVMCDVVTRGPTIGCRAEGERTRYRARCGGWYVERSAEGDSVPRRSRPGHRRRPVSPHEPAA